MPRSRTAFAAAALLLAAAACLTGAPRPASAQDDDDEGLQGLLEDVGAEYARGYLAPLIQSFGANQNGGLYSTASIPLARLTFSIGVRAMAAKIADEDAVFSRVVGVTLDEDYGVQPGDPGYGQQGTVEMSGPSAFGDEDVEGIVRAYYLGALVAETPGIEGAWHTDWAPLAMPEASIGGIAGLRATVRWLPAIDLGDVGEFKLWGIGLQYSVNGLVPTLPLDVMVGYFRQSLDIGDVISADASSWFLAASRSFGVATVYGGAALESSEFDVDYEWQRGPGDVVPVAFSVDGLQESRFTLGATLNLGVRLNADVNVGSELTTYTAGLMFGI